MKKSQMFEYKLITFPLASYVLLKKHGVRTRFRYRTGKLSHRRHNFPIFL